MKPLINKDLCKVQGGAGLNYNPFFSELSPQGAIVACCANTSFLIASYGFNLSNEKSIACMFGGFLVGMAIMSYC